MSAIMMVMISFGMLNFILLMAAVIMYLERKAMGDIQVRYGPMRVGFHGILQPIADMLKIVGKEEIIPNGIDKLIFKVAPFVVFVPACMILVTLPLSKTLQVRDLSIGIFYVIAVITISTVGMIMAGWSSHNKYSMLGGVRAAGQLISYELSLSLVVISVVMLAGTLSMKGIVGAQKSLWYILIQPVGFIIFFLGTMAELCRIPFDLPEAESELVAGYFIEYSGIRFMIFLLAEYMNLFTMCAIATILFLGGWNGPFLPGIVWFLIKVYLLILILIWIRGTLPRVRADQLMTLGWKVLLPLSLLNLGITGYVMLAIG